MQRIESQFGDVDFIMTVGDNNYWDGSCASIKDNIGQYFDTYFTHGDCTNPSLHQNTKRTPPSVQQSSIKFFPSLGNHDWDTYSNFGVKNLPYIQYFNYLPSFEPQSSYGQFYTVDPLSGNILFHCNKSISLTLLQVQGKPHSEGLLQLFALNSNIVNSSLPEHHKMAEDQKTWLQDSLKNSNAIWKLVYFHHSPYTTAKHDPPGMFHLFVFNCVVSKFTR